MHSKTLLSKEARCNWAAAARRQKFCKWLPDKIELLCSPLYKYRHKNSNATCALQTIIHETKLVLIFVGRSVSNQQHSQQLQHKLLSVRLFWQTSNLGFQIALSAAIFCHNCKWKRGWVAPCTVDCKMQATQLLMALTSPITQQTDCFICGSQFKNACHLERCKITMNRESK